MYVLPPDLFNRNARSLKATLTINLVNKIYIIFYKNYIDKFILKRTFQ
jgi:hypothetical protein